MRNHADKAWYFTYKSLHFRSGGTRTRTGDTMIFSHVLYHLSYPAVRRGLLQNQTRN
jgi:hypothetical protein